MEKSSTRFSQMQWSVGATSTTKSPIQHCSKTLLYLTANTWVIFSKSDHQCKDGSGAGAGHSDAPVHASWQHHKNPPPPRSGTLKEDPGKHHPKAEWAKSKDMVLISRKSPLASKASNRTIPKPQRKLAASYYLPCPSHSSSLSPTSWGP